MTTPGSASSALLLDQRWTTHIACTSTSTLSHFHTHTSADADARGLPLHAPLARLLQLPPCALCLCLCPARACLLRLLPAATAATAVKLRRYRCASLSPGLFCRTRPAGPSRISSPPPNPHLHTPPRPLHQPPSIIRRPHTNPHAASSTPSTPPQSSSCFSPAPNLRRSPSLIIAWCCLFPPAPDPPSLPQSVCPLAAPICLRLVAHHLGLTVGSYYFQYSLSPCLGCRLNSI